MNNTRPFSLWTLLLANAVLTALLGFWLAAYPRALLSLFPAAVKPESLALLQAIGVLLFGAGLSLWTLVDVRRTDVLSRVAQVVAVALVSTWIVLLMISMGAELGVLSFTMMGLILICLGVWAVLSKRFGDGPGAFDPAGGSAAQEERRRLARDLHDSIKQQLFSIKLSSAAAEERWERDQGGARAALADVRRSAHAAMVEMQALLTQLRPEPLAAAGLVDALREQCEALGYRTGARVDFEVGDLPPDDRLPASAQENLFRIAQEALSNVARHARAGTVRVRLATVGEALGLSIQDDGQGFDREAPSSGVGLRNMRERVELLGGALEIDSAPGSGTRLSASIPLTSPASEEAAGEYPFLIKLALLLAFVGLFIEPQQSFWVALGLCFVVQGSLKVYRAEKSWGDSRVEIRRLYHQQLFFIAALHFWWAFAGIPQPPADKMSWLDRILTMWGYAPWLIAPVAGGLACWAAWRFLRLRRVRSTKEPLHNPWLFAALLGLFLVSIPCLWLADPATIAILASKLASALYVAWVLRPLAIEAES